MLDDLGSTSWHNRHFGPFARLNELLTEAGVARPSIMIVGPGGVSRWLAPLLNNSAADSSFVRKTIGDLARYSDQVLRRFPFVPLVSLEPLEVRETMLMPHDLTVVDRSARLLEAVRRDIPEAITHVVDLGLNAPPARADVVIAFNIVSRLDDRAADGINHLLTVLRGGGWLLIDDRSAKAHLANNPRVSQVAPKTHRVDAAG